MVKNIFIIGSKGIPAKYGGFETFVENLTKLKQDQNLRYHVSCMSNENNEFYYNDSRCFNIKVPEIGPAKAVYYDVLAMKNSLNYIKKNEIKDATIYILACRIGPFLKYYNKQIKKLGVKVYINPDGHEWKRDKWNKFIKWYWKYSEKLMVKNSDLVVCDSKNIEKYILDEYEKYSPKTTFISYGASTLKSNLQDNSIKVQEWYQKFDISPKKFFLVVGRFVPENNYETIIAEFIKSNIDLDCVIITNLEKNNYYNKLLANTSFNKDKRIKFVGTVYDQELLKKLREDAFGYIHGHEVGGTNPSLLEALASTQLNLLLDVGFNKEVAEESAYYWNKESGNLCTLLNNSLNLTTDVITKMDEKSTERISENYNWDRIVKGYELLFKD